MSDRNPELDPRIKAAIAALGPTRKAQAAALGITHRQLSTWFSKGPPRLFRATPAIVLHAVAEAKEAAELQPA